MTLAASYVTHGDGGGRYLVVRGQAAPQVGAQVQYPIAGQWQTQLVTETITSVALDDSLESAEWRAGTGERAWRVEAQS